MFQGYLTTFQSKQHKPEKVTTPSIRLNIPPLEVYKKSLKNVSVYSIIHIFLNLVINCCEFIDFAQFFDLFERNYDLIQVVGIKFAQNRKLQQKPYELKKMLVRFDNSLTVEKFYQLHVMQLMFYKTNILSSIKDIFNEDIIVIIVEYVLSDYVYMEQIEKKDGKPSKKTLKLLKNNSPLIHSCHAELDTFVYYYILRDLIKVNFKVWDTMQIIRFFSLYLGSSQNSKIMFDIISDNQINGQSLLCYDHILNLVSNAISLHNHSNQNKISEDFFKKIKTLLIYLNELNTKDNNN